MDLFEETSILIPWSLFFFPSFCRLRGRITSSNSLSFSLFIAHSGLLFALLEEKWGGEDFRDAGLIR